MDWVKLLVETKKVLLTRRAAGFFVLLALLEIPFAIDWISVFALVLLIKGLGVGPSYLVLGFTDMTILIFLAILGFFILNIITRAAFINYAGAGGLFMRWKIRGIRFNFKKFCASAVALTFLGLLGTQLIISIWCGIPTLVALGLFTAFVFPRWLETASGKKITAAVGAAFAIVALQFLIINGPALVSPGFWQLGTETEIPTTLQIAPAAAVPPGLVPVAGVTFGLFEALAGFGKPILLGMAGVSNFCLLGFVPCAAVFSVFFSNLGLLQVALYMLISILFLFVLQEIMLSNSGAAQALKRSYALVKANAANVLVLWVLSLLIYVLIIGAGAAVTWGLGLMVGGGGSIVYHLFAVAALLAVFALQTRVWIRLKK